MQILLITKNYFCWHIHIYSAKYIWVLKGTAHRQMLQKILKQADALLMLCTV